MYTTKFFTGIPPKISSVYDGDCAFKESNPLEYNCKQIKQKAKNTNFFIPKFCVCINDWSYIAEDD